jgi:hypothetical protein
MEHCAARRRFIGRLGHPAQESPMNNYRGTIASVLTIFLVICARTAAGADSDAMMKVTRAGGLDKYPRANIVFVEKRRDIRYEEDGSYVDTSYALIKFLTAPAVQYFATIPVLEYYSYRSEGKVLFARTIKPTGAIAEVPPEMITDVVNPMYADLNVADAGMRVKQIAFKDLQVGDAVEYAVEERCVRPLGPSFELKEGKYLQEDEPLIYTRIQIDGPDSMPLRHMVKCADKLAIRFSSEKKGGRNVCVWEASDVPVFISEPGWNTRQHFAARLLASTISSWQEISRTGYRLSRPAMDEDAALRAVVCELTRGLQTDEEKISALQLFLRSNIRYKGVTSVSAYQSKPATRTLADRFGVCRDVAVLMCSMLNVAGIKSYPAATGYNRVFDSEIPHDIFQHMIVAVPEAKGGGYRLYDPTTPLFFGDRLPGYAGGAPLLVCTPRGEDLTRVPHIPALENMGKILARSVIDAAGALSSVVKISGRGFYDEDLRNWRKRTPQDAYVKRWKEIVAQLHPAARLLEVTTSDPEDLHVPFSLSLSYEVPGYAAVEGSTVTLAAPVASDCFERVVRDIVARADRPARAYPFIVTSAAGVQADESITLPEGYKVQSTPESVSVESKNVALAVQYSTSLGAVEFRKVFVVDSRRFETENYADLKKILDANSSSRNGRITAVRAN